jgi:hypothetical protein
LSEPIALLGQVVGKHEDWYLTDFALGDELLEAKENVIDPIQSFLSGPQRSIYDEASAMLSTHASNLGFLAAGSAATVLSALADPNAFRGNKMNQLKRAAEELGSQLDEVITANRSTVAAAIENRRAELTSGSFFAEATPEAKRQADQLMNSTVSRVDHENQVGLILQIGANFEAKDYPALVDLLAASQPKQDDEAPPKQTVSVKTIQVPGASGVLDSEDDVDRYLTALRWALVETLNHGKRISL